MSKDIKSFMRDRRNKKQLNNIKEILATFGFLVLFYLVAIVLNLSY